MIAQFLFKQEQKSWKTSKAPSEQCVWRTKDGSTLSLIIFRPVLFFILFGGENTKPIVWKAAVICFYPDCKIPLMRKQRVTFKKSGISFKLLKQVSRI